MIIYERCVMCDSGAGEGVNCSSWKCGRMEECTLRGR